MSDDVRNAQDGFRARVQVDEGFYHAAAYATPERFYSYGVQVQAVLGSGAGSVLEVGPGPGVVRSFLCDAGVRVVSLDLDPATRPEVVADMIHLPVASNAVDTVLCCQVLEHVPYALAEKALGELRRVARGSAVVSVPDVTPYYYLDMAIPKLRISRRWSVPWHRPRPMAFDGQHHWSLGVGDVDVERFRASLGAAGWKVADELRPSANDYHRFFFLE